MNSGQMEKRLEWTGLDQNAPQPGPELVTGAPKGPSNPQTQLPLPTAPLSLRCEFLSQVSGSLKPTSPHSHTQPAQTGSGTCLPAHGGPCGRDRDTCVKIMPFLSPKGRAGRDLTPNHAPVKNAQAQDTNIPEGGGENVPGKNAPVCYSGCPAWDAEMKPAWLPSHSCSLPARQAAPGSTLTQQRPKLSKATDLPTEMLASSYEWGSPWIHGLFKVFGAGRGKPQSFPQIRTNLHFPERIKKFVMSVG